MYTLVCFLALVELVLEFVQPIDNSTGRSSINVNVGHDGIQFAILREARLLGKSKKKMMKK